MGETHPGGMYNTINFALKTIIFIANGRYSTTYIWTYYISMTKLKLNEALFATFYFYSTD